MPSRKDKKKSNFNIVASESKSKIKNKFPIKTSNVSFRESYPYFSFKHYHNTSKKFSFENFNNQEYKKFFDDLKKMSDYKWKQIFDDYKDYYHAHPVIWSKTAYPNGFSHNPQIKDFPVYQFKVFKCCRIFGYFNEHNIFKIVWVDKNHLVYPRG